MGAKKRKNEGFITCTLRFPVEWHPIMEKSVKLSDYKSMNAFVLSVIARTPEVIKAWEMAGKPVLPELIRKIGNPNLARKRTMTAPSTKGLWGRPLDDDDDDTA